MMPRRAALGDPCHDGDRNRQDEGARRRHHQYGEAPDGVPGERPGSRCEHQRDGDEHVGEPVGQPDRGRLRLLRLEHETYDPGVRAVLCAGRRPQVEAATGVHGAGPDAVVPRPLDGTRLTGQRRLVQHAVIQHHPVDGHHLARLHEEAVAERNFLDRAGGKGVILVTGDRPRRPCQQRGQLFVRAPVGVGLEGVAARHHQRDHRSRQVLPEGKRASHRQERDHVHACLSVDEPGYHFARHRDDAEQGGQRPREPRRLVQPHRPQHAPECDPDDRERERYRCEVAGASDRTALAHRSI